jgi:hypothetical protein
MHTSSGIIMNIYKQINESCRHKDAWTGILPQTIPGSIYRKASDAFSGKQSESFGEHDSG